MRCATFNTLADAYTSYGDYSHVDPGLLLPGARIRGIVRLIDSLDIEVMGLQEVEIPLLRALEATGNWQTLWSTKKHAKADGCLMLVKRGIEIGAFRSYEYGDHTGHVAQILNIGSVIFANTHLKWAPTDAPGHIGVAQAGELLERIGSGRAAVIFADCNDEPDGPVRQLIEEAGFTSACGDQATSVVDQVPVALDLLAVRGIAARCITMNYRAENIPNENCPSDHIPLVADLDII